MLTVQRRQKLKWLWPFYIWLAAFYSTWLGIIIFGHHGSTLIEHWGISVAMAIGSYFAGSTPLGGGTVGFPVLVLLFDQPATIGRDFSFAIQSIGMVSASIFLLCLRQRLEWVMLRWGMIGIAIGTPIGAAFIAPNAPDLLIKLLFAVVWLSFGILHFVKLNEIASAKGIRPLSMTMDRIAGLLVGLLSGLLMVSVTGVGVDMAIYAFLVLVSRADLKIAIPTSVVLMAFASLVGLASNLLLHELRPAQFAFSPEVFKNWIAAAPIVALGAPIGAFVVRRIGRKPTLLVVSALCVIQFVWTCYDERENMGIVAWMLTIVGVLLFNLGFHALHAWGDRLGKKGRPKENAATNSAAAS